MLDLGLEYWMWNWSVVIDIYRGKRNVEIGIGILEVGLDWWS